MNEEDKITLVAAMFAAAAFSRGVEHAFTAEDHHETARKFVAKEHTLCCPSTPEPEPVARVEE